MRKQSVPGPLLLRGRGLGTRLGFIQDFFIEGGNDHMAIRPQKKIILIIWRTRYWLILLEYANVVY